MYTLYDTSHHKHHTITCKNVAFRIRKYRGKTHCTHPSTLKCSLSFWEQGNIQYTLFKHNSILDFHLRTLTSQEKSCVRIHFQTSIGITTGFALKRALYRELALWSIPSFTFEIVLRQRKQPSSTVHCKTKNSNK